MQHQKWASDTSCDRLGNKHQQQYNPEINTDIKVNNETEVEADS